MKEVTFNFELEQKVKTKFGVEGFIESMAVDAGGKKYFVQTEIGDGKGRWLREDEFTPV